MRYKKDEETDEYKLCESQPCVMCTEAIIRSGNIGNIVYSTREGTLKESKVSDFSSTYYTKGFITACEDEDPKIVINKVLAKIRGF